MDSITLSLLAREIDEKLQGSRVDKVHQPSKDEVVFHLLQKRRKFEIAFVGKEWFRKNMHHGGEF